MKYIGDTYIYDRVFSRVQFLMNYVGEDEAKDERVSKFSPPLGASLET